MLTLVESISLAGDRKKQNDDACGLAAGAAWVIDGATDLHKTPLTGAASDAAWIAHQANSYFHAHAGPSDAGGMRALLRDASADAKAAYGKIATLAADEPWRAPMCSLLLAAETGAGVSVIEIGDCRIFALDADGDVRARGGPPATVDAETSLARDYAKETVKPLLDRTDTIAMLRNVRSRQNGGGLSWTFCLKPECAEHARVFDLALKRPAHILLCTDGFSALVDRYVAYDAAGLVRAALDKGLQELGRDLRAIETQDAGAALHPRFKVSDDATALLLRLA